MEKQEIPLAFAFVTMPNRAVTPTTLNSEGIGRIDLFEPLLGNQTFQITLHDVVVDTQVDFSEYENIFLPEIQIIHANGIGNETGEVLLQISIPPLFGEWLIPIPGNFVALDIVPSNEKNENVDEIQLANERQLLIKGNGKTMQTQVVIVVKAPELFFSINNNTIRGTLTILEPFDQIRGILGIPEKLRIKKMAFAERNITGRILFFRGNQIGVELWPEAPGVYQFDILLDLYGEQENIERNSNTPAPLFMGVVFFLIGIGSLGGSIAIIYKKRLDTKIEFVI